MNRENTREGQAVAVAGGSVAGMNEGVVFAPVGKFIPSPKQSVFYLAFHILDSVQKAVGGLTIVGARGTTTATAHACLASVDCHLGGGGVMMYAVQLDARENDFVLALSFLFLFLRIPELVLPRLTY